MLPGLFIGGYLTASRIYYFLDAFNEYYAAGCVLIFQQHLFFVAPVLLLAVSGALGLLQSMIGIPYSVISIVFIISMFISAPVMYFKRITFAVLALVLFAQVSVTLFLLALRLDGVVLWPYVAIDLGLAFTAVITMIKYRMWLGYVWDVSLIIRPTQYDFYEKTFIAQELHDLKKHLKRWWKGRQRQANGDDAGGLGATTPEGEEAKEDGDVEIPVVVAEDSIES